MTRTQPHRFVYRATLLLASVLCVSMSTTSFAQKPKDMVYEPVTPPASDDYTLGPDSKPQPNVPKGNVFTFTLSDSKTFPDTTRTITVYVPAQYSAKKPACLYVGLDGLGFNATVAFDNLIAQHAIPVTIAIGISPGEVPSANAPDDPRYDRSMEFDTRSSRLATFILEELIPGVERHKTSNGEPIMISRDPNDHAIGGGSTGGIGAFTVAWERPDAFRRVFSSIGTYVGMRGGEQYYVQVRKTEPKPIRVFMQDGASDNCCGGVVGDWFMSNVTMNRALEYAGYDVKHVWGTGTHSGAHATALFPDAMRWLWRDYPAAIQAKAPGNPRLKEIEPDGETWHLAGTACGKAPTLAANPKGEVFVGRSGAQEPLLLTADAVAGSCGTADASRISLALMFGPDGSQYMALPTGGIKVSTPGSGGDEVVGKSIGVSSFTVRNNGDIYATTQTDALWGQLWLIRKNGETVKLDDRIKGPLGVAFLPDGLWLFVGQNLSHQGLSYRVLKDGKVDAREPLFEFYVPDTADDCGATGVAMDRNGWAYAATRTGVQIFDRNGRVFVMLPLPGGEAATSITFGGPDFSTLYVAGAGGKIYERKMKVPGFLPFSTTIPLPKNNAG